jgi:ribosomal protein L27
LIFPPFQFTEIRNISNIKDHAVFRVVDGELFFNPGESKKKKKVIAQ